MTAPTLVAAERAELADLLDALGPDAPTCCEGWSTAHLAAHLVVRESRPDAMPGYGVEKLPGGAVLAGWSHRAEDRLRTSTPHAAVVARLRSGPPAWSPFAWPVVGERMNAGEFVIHHEDVRRAQPEWAPRALPRSVQDRLWPAVRLFGLMAAGRRRRVVLRRSDVPAAEVRLGRGTEVTTVEGEPLELLLWASGRGRVARVEIS